MRVTAVHASASWAAELHTEQLEGRLCPVHKDVNVLELREAPNLVKPARMYKPVQCHVGLDALPAAGECLTTCLLCGTMKVGIHDTTILRPCCPPQSCKTHLSNSSKIW